MSVITGDAVPAVRDMEEKEVVDECMRVLRELFKEQVNLSHLMFNPADEVNNKTNNDRNYYFFIF